MGTLAAIPLWWVLAQLPDYIYLFATFAVCVGGIFVSQAYESQLGNHDSQDIVIDEVAGFLITMALLPMTWKSLVLGFLLFRLLDITKPYPIGMLDKKIQGGTGVMIDDIAAGIVASVILQLVFHIWPFVLV